MVTRTFIIAEAGVNHNGDLSLAKKLVEVAAETGADAVKFQTFQADKLVSKSAEKAPYQLKTTGMRESQYEMISRLELSAEDHLVLIDHCKKNKIAFLSSPFDEESVDLLDRLGVLLFKIPSGEITNEPFLKHVASKKRPIILSTGMSTLEEVKEAVKWIRSKSEAELTLLHCVTEYPAPYDQINLRAMLTLHNLGLPVGYSDHTEGIDIAIAAVALGASIIEKHFTLDRNLPGPDHLASLEPEEFGQMVTAIRKVESSLGHGTKEPAPCELENRKVARKSLVAKHDLQAGHVIRPEDISSKRPGNGIPPFLVNSLIGKSLRKPIAKDELISWGHFQTQTDE